MNPFSPKNSNLRRLAMLLSVAGFIALFLLSMSISSLEFQPGQPLTVGAPVFKFPILSFEGSTWWASLCLSLILVMTPIGLVLLIFSREARKMFKKNMKGVLLWLIIFAILLYLIRNKNDSVSYDQSNPSVTRSEVVELASSVGEIGVPDIYIAPDLLPWQSFFMGFFLVITVGVIVYTLWASKRSQRGELDKIALQTMREISAGRRWEDAVIQCYAQMSSVISQQRKLYRENSMTPNEFARQLEFAGLPPNPVNRLTRLFERARYGMGSSDTSEAREAVQCLAEIVHAVEGIE